MTVVRWYFQNAVAPYDPPTARGAWDTATYVGIKVDAAKAGAAATASASNTVNTLNYDQLILKAVSPAFASDGVIKGLINFCLGVHEFGATNDAAFHVHIFITAGDSDTVRGTVLTDAILGTEWALTTNTGKAISNVAATEVPFSAGDRVVIELGARDQNNVISNAIYTVTYGGTGGTDLTDGSTNTTNEPGWIEFDISIDEGGLLCVF